MCATCQVYAGDLSCNMQNLPMHTHTQTQIHTLYSYTLYTSHGNTGTDLPSLWWCACV